MTKTLLFAAALLAAAPALAAETGPAKKTGEGVNQAPPPENVPPAPPEEDKGSGKIGQSPFRIRTSRPNYSEAEIGRPLVLQKEWAEFALTHRVREVTEVTDAEGNTQDAGYTYVPSWVTFDARYYRRLPSGMGEEMGSR